MITLKRLYSDTGLLVKDVTFTKGINVILGRYFSGQDARGINGIGKSSLVRLIDYCLLSDSAQKRFSRDHYDFLREEAHNIALEISQDDRRFFIKRYFNQEKTVLFGTNPDSLDEYTDAELKNVLENKFFPTENEKVILPGNRYRTIMNFFIKDDLDHQQRIDPTKFFPWNPPAREKAIYNFFLLNLPTISLLEFDELSKSYIEKRNMLKGIEKKVQEDTGKSIEEYRSEKVKIEKNVEALEVSLREYKFLENYKNAEARLVDLTSKINQKLEVFHSLEQKINKIKSAYDAQSNVDTREVKILYNEVLENFGDLVKKQLDEVTEFKKQLLENRRKFLFQQEKKLENESKDILNDISVLEKERSKLYQVLKEEGALDSIENAYEQIIAEKSSLDRTLQTLNQVEEINKSLIDFQEEFFEIKKSIINELDENKQRIEELRRLFLEILESAIFLDEQFENAFFDISYKANSRIDQLPFKIVVEIPKTDALGQSRLELIAYDLMVFLKNVTDGRNFPGFLVHDGVFHAIARDTVLNVLNYIHHKFLESPNFQYITTFNEDELPSEQYGTLDFDLNNNVIIELEETERNMLFRRLF